MASTGPGVVPAAWLEQRGVGEGRLTGRFVELGHSETLPVLRSALAARMVHHGVHDLDAAAIRLSVPREFTQDISRHVLPFDLDDPDLAHALQLHKLTLSIVD